MPSSEIFLQVHHQELPVFLFLPLAFPIKNFIWNRTQNLQVSHLAVDNFNVLLTTEALSDDDGAAPAQDFSAHGQNWSRTPPSAYVANVGHLPRDARFDWPICPRTGILVLQLAADPCSRGIGGCYSVNSRSSVLL